MDKTIRVGEGASKSPDGKPAQSARVEPQPVVPFESLEDFIAAHTELLNQELGLEETSDPTFVERVKDLVSRGAATGLLLEAVSDRRTAQSFLNYWVTVLYRVGDRATNAILAGYSRPVDKDLAAAQFPYKGLHPFTEADRDSFYGRKQLTTDTIERLKEGSLVVVVGPSGSGKTSLINAGVIPEIKKGMMLPGSEGWRHFPTLVPGRDPLASLATLLVSGAENTPERITQEAEKLLQAPDYLVQQFNDPKFAGVPIVLVVDQFDDVFTISKDDKKRDAFIANVLNLVKSTPSKHKVILAVRTDRINHIVHRADLNDLFLEVELRIHPFSEKELHDVIEKPARAVGLQFQQGVVERLIREIFGDLVGPPLLQFGLLRLWDEREGNTITWAAMTRMGTCRNALVQSAAKFYNALSSDEKRVTRRILLKMVRLSDTLEVASDTARREDLYQQDETRESVNLLLDKLVIANLVRLTPSMKATVGPGGDGGSTGESIGESINGEKSPDDQFELAHDCLARDWPELMGWLRKLREVMLTRQRLESLAANWAILGRKDVGLLDRFQLHDAEKWLQLPEATELGYQENLVALTQKSREAIDRERLIKRLLFAGAVGVIVVALIVAVIVAVIFHKGWTRSTSRELAHRANEFKNTKLDTALLLSLAAFDKDPANPDAVKRLVNSLFYSPKLKTFLHTGEQPVVQMAFSPDGSKLSAVTREGATTVWNTHQRTPIRPPSAPHQPEESRQDRDRQEPTDSAFLLSDSGRLLLSPGDGKHLVLWDVQSGNQLETIPAQNVEKSWPIAAFSKDDRKVAWLTPDNASELSVWDSSSKRVQMLGSEELQALAFSPDNETLAGGTKDGDILLWQANNLKSPVKRLEGAFEPDSLPRILFNRDGKRLASIDAWKKITVWSVTDQKKLGSLPKTVDADVQSFAMSSNGEKVVAGYSDGTLVLWNVLKKDDSAVIELGKFENQVTQIAFSLDDKNVVTAGDREDLVRLWDLSKAGTFLARYSSGDREYVVRLWNLRPKFSVKELPTGRSGMISALSFSPDDRTFAAVSGGTIILWDFRRTLVGEQLASPSKERGSVRGQIFGSNSNRLISRYESGEIVPIDMNTKEVQSFSITPSDSREAISTGQAAVSNDGRVLAVLGVGQFDTFITLWDVDSGTQTRVLRFDQGTNSPQTPENPLGSSDDSVKSIAISRDGSKVASGNNSGQIILWDLANETSIRSQGDSHPALSLAFSPDGTQLASGADNGVITLRSTTNLESLFKLPDEAGDSISNLSFSPDATKLASVSEDGTVNFWDLESESRTLSRFETEVNNVFFNPQGNLLACLRNDGSIVFWDMESLDRLWDFRLSDDSPVRSLAFHSDGKTLAAGHEDGSIQLISIGADAWRRRACEIANRNLSDLEIAEHHVLEDQKVIRKLLFWKDEEYFYTQPCPDLPAKKLF